MKRRSRLLAPLLLACLALVVTAPGVFALSARYPTQSLGNRGSDVQAIQAMLTSKGYSLTFDGVFGTDTRNAVSEFQESRGLPATGIVDDATWGRLLTQVGPGSVGMPVVVLQRQLNEKRRARLVTDGIYGSATTAAVIAFQRHMGLGATGVVTLQTWRWLLGHFETPAFSKSSVCDYSVGNGLANWGTGAAIGQLESAARIVVKAGFGRVAVGDIGLEHGGAIPGHVSHRVGLDVDVRPMRDANDQCVGRTNWRVASYDRRATRALVKAIRATGRGHVKLIYFNDPVLIREGLVRAHSGHDDHLHIRYCEAIHRNPLYDC
jgi:peptidoglycan hydrolase-like protein with peptidoglycan-binding domain